MNIERVDNYGSVDSDTGVFTFEILSAQTNLTKPETEQTTFDRFLNNQYNVMKFKDYFIAPYDQATNNLPQEIMDNLRSNHILPEVIEKQIRLLYGQGPYLYKEEIRDKEKVKIPVVDAEITNWLESWKVKGLINDYRTYLQNVIREFYYTEGIFSKYVFVKGRKVPNIPMPVAGLEYISSKVCRFATKNKEYINNQKIWKDADFNFVAVGNWTNPQHNDYEVFPVFNESKPLEFPLAINYSKNSSFGIELYSYPVFYYGLKYWITGSNAVPKQLKSFFQNLLTAKFHVKIPGTWIDKKRSVLREIIEKNRELYDAERPVITEYNGITLVDSSNVPLDYRETFINQLINKELEKLTKLMSGENNAGKLWSTIKYHTEYGLEEWDIVDIPLKIKEFVDSVISYDKRSVEAILEGKGVDPSLTNVSKDGIISNSGSNVYYNYLIYLNSLQIPEEICTYDINKAIRLNFPTKKDIRLGFYHNIPAKQQDVTPKDRLTETQPNN
jgi:hypothetical protein